MCVRVQLAFLIMRPLTSPQHTQSLARNNTSTFITLASHPRAYNQKAIMSTDDLVAELVKEEEMNDPDAQDYDYIDEEDIRARAKRGNNKAVLKNIKGFVDATPAATRKFPSKSPAKNAQKATTPRSQQMIVIDKSDWETKLKISRRQQKQTNGDNYTLEPVKVDGHEEDVKSATPRTSKFAFTLGDDAGSDETGKTALVEARLNVEDASTKDGVKARNAWDDENPWG